MQQSCCNSCGVGGGGKEGGGVVVKQRITALCSTRTKMHFMAGRAEQNIG
jgi:hypothetical protein